MDITVLLGDPRLPYSYNLSNQFEPQDHLAVSRLREALDTLTGYRFQFLDDHERLWQTLEQDRPALVLNFCNTGYRNAPTRQLHITAMLEMLEVPYAGAGPEAMVLCHHKYHVYAQAADLGVPVPWNILADPAQPDVRLPELYPAFIKANGGDGSIGIGPNSLVHGPDEAERCLRELHALLPEQLALIQDYLPGPEYSVGVVGNPHSGLTVLPPLQIDFSALDDDLPPIMTYESKVDPHSPYWEKVRFIPAESERACQHMTAYAKLMFERMGCRDYARMDFRADAEGMPRLIDINAHPMWGEGGMLATVTSYQGRSYAQLLESIIDAARTRMQL
ncbi:D-alanine--D-alanine ligase [Aquisalimonas sp.]|uniref:D-alanine--D-alanine ligase family protein n=1 Tax=Aquisalimonas sp. TaxID=1872621 RepID=UPI0025C461E1|nr:D-alanine--D-alanine ligase [Aquisalimonas sp.]